MFVALWEFEVKPGNEELFETVYGPKGDWARLFRTDQSYRGTFLPRDMNRNRVYLTIDAWNSRDAYEAFRAAKNDKYEEMDEKCAELTERERKIGEYECLARNH